MLHFDPPTLLGKGGARKAFVANIKEIDMNRLNLNGICSISPQETERYDSLKIRIARAYAGHTE
jgi:hypothetical protein